MLRETLGRLVQTLQQNPTLSVNEPIKLAHRAGIQSRIQHLAIHGEAWMLARNVEHRKLAPNQVVVHPHHRPVRIELGARLQEIIGGFVCVKDECALGIETVGDDRRACRYITVAEETLVKTSSEMKGRDGLN